MATVLLFPFRASNYCYHISIPQLKYMATLITFNSLKVNLLNMNHIEISGTRKFNVYTAKYKKHKSYHK
jgi:hypothetical protein